MNIVWENMSQKCEQQTIVVPTQNHTKPCSIKPTKYRLEDRRVQHV
jgi:hypothetical protein